MVAVVAIKRLRANTFGAKAMPRLDVRRAVAVGFIVGVLVEAALSFRDSAPISTFLSNVAFVLWVTLFVALAGQGSSADWPSCDPPTSGIADSTIHKRESSESDRSGLPWPPARSPGAASVDRNR